ncbi:hypothetical protein BDF14DRAFT_1750098 [Spinellus fusiger]|nr:hypothetical protein BDF14DRAFT_1750098 [Spinellus fusiger]
MIDPLATVRKAFEFTPDQFKALVDGFQQEYELGLTTDSTSIATMIPSYVTRLPTGYEKGTFLALDLGGSTLRVSAVQLLGQGQVNVTEVRRTIAFNDPLRTGSYKAFFDWIADAVEELLSKIDTHTPLSMGICWSFPINQTDISTGTILRMGKGFEIKDIEGKDLNTLCSEAFRRKAILVTVTALMNDTVGVLVAHAYAHPKSRIGFIHGTGVNAAYPEKTSRIPKLKGHTYPPDTEMLINTEIDIFGSEAYLPINAFDRALDASHSQPKFQLYEKMMSGAYLGELTRLAAMELIQNETLFEGNIPKEFEQPWAFSSASTCQIESITSASWEEQQESLKNTVTFNNDYQITQYDYSLLSEIANIISDRAAKLVGGAMASLIEQQKDLLLSTNEPIVIGVNGSVFELYPRMSERIQACLADWFGPDVSKRIDISMAIEGGTIGSALVAMLYQPR